MNGSLLALDSCQSAIPRVPERERAVVTALGDGLTASRCESLFAFMHHNAQRPGAYFRIPAAQIMEVGVEFDI